MYGELLETVLYHLLANRLNGDSTVNDIPFLVGAQFGFVSIAKSDAYPPRRHLTEIFSHRMFDGMQKQFPD